jgi:enamine deaminase RidA (YjgF/YER057c/UK114 family)
MGFRSKGGDLSGLLKCLPLFAMCLLLDVFGPKLFAQVGAPTVIRPTDYKEKGTTSAPGILANDTLYVSAQGGFNSDGSVPKDFRQEVGQALQGVQGVLHAAGMDFKNIVSINIYVKNAKNIAAMNEIYWRTVGDDPPARAVLVVGDLPNKRNIEISSIAVKTSHRQVIHPQGWPSGPHVDPAGIQADDVLYLSAQNGADPLSGKLPTDFGSEVKQALDNVASVLKAANMSMANVVWVNPYMSSSGAQERVMNRTYSTYFELGNAAGRGTFTVVDLPNGSHIVFSCIAGADLSKRKVVRPKNERPSPTSNPGVLYGDTLYLSAKDAFVPALGIISPALDVQTKLSMRNLLDGLQEAGMDFTNVVSSTIYLRDIKDADQVNILYQKFFKNGFPTQTVLQQNFDVNNIDTEQISMIAVGSPAH